MLLSQEEQETLRANLVEYHKVRGAARAEYDKVAGAARAEYDKVAGAAWPEYRKIADAAWAEYDKVRDTAWVNLSGGTGPVVAWIVDNCEGWAEYSLEVLELLSEGASVAHLDRTVSFAGCPTWKKFQDQAVRELSLDT